MFKSTLFILTCLLAIAFCQDNNSTQSSPYIRFINTIEGSDMTIYTNGYGTFHVSYLQITDYIAVAGGSLSVTNVINGTGFSLTNANPLLLQFGDFATFALIMEGTQFYMIYLNDTLPAGYSASSSEAFVRLVDLSSAYTYLTLASAGGSADQYVGYLEAAGYSSISTSVTSMVIFDSQNGNYNKPILTIPTSFTAGELYAVYFVTDSTGNKAIIAQSSSSTIGQSTPSSSASSTSTGPVIIGSSTSTSGHTEGNSGNVAFVSFALLVASLMF